MDLLNICLTSTYFQYNGKHYKQLHGTAMGSPVSVVIAEIVMQNIEERALSTCRQTIPLWLRYVDDTFTAVRHDEIDAFHNHLNEQNTDIQFTREVEENGKLPFLDCLVSHNDNSLRTTVYRKPTHTDRLLDESSYNPTSHKATTIRTLTRRAQLVCDSTDSLSDENKYLHRVFTKNNYNNDFIRRNTHRPTTTTETNDTATPTTTATIPYIKGMSENISRILLPFNIRVAHKPITTLRQLLTNVKDKDEPRNRQGTIYKINCSDCQASYIGETGRNLTTRLTEHRRATRKGDETEILSTVRRTRWLAGISRADLAEKILENDRVCGIHFHSEKAAQLWDLLHPDWVPTLHLGHDNRKKSDERKEQQQQERAQRITERRKREREREEQEAMQRKAVKVNEPGEPIRDLYMMNEGETFGETGDQDIKRKPSPSYHHV
ncbi:hypothetical protein AWC38_SpisGene13437 [Stylophora pistillata]|uniref:Helix-turn-helix domain-containing protein n=1 Tax=Stylophora pistillata TaxID=50429 RepID=A0A2B4S0F6_STYPI|nr:hypothetical protein AWC38_SpisGene13437 [Stylophora pistillata]